MAASSLDLPFAISTQNLCRCSRCQPGGCPGDRSLPRIGHVVFCCLVTPIAQPPLSGCCVDRLNSPSTCLGSSAGCAALSAYGSRWEEQGRAMTTASPNRFGRRSSGSSSLGAGSHHAHKPHGQSSPGSITTTPCGCTRLSAMSRRSSGSCVISARSRHRKQRQRENHALRSPESLWNQPSDIDHRANRKSFSIYHQSNVRVSG